MQRVASWSHVGERDRRHSASWTERERASDLAWISDNLRVSWPMAQQRHKERGRGGIVVDTTQRPTGEGHTFGYSPQAKVEQTGDEDTKRIVCVYDPSGQMVTVLLKIDGRTSTYRAGMLAEKPRE